MGVTVQEAQVAEGQKIREGRDSGWGRTTKLKTQRRGLIFRAMILTTGRFDTSSPEDMGPCSVVPVDTGDSVGLQLR